MQHSVLNTLDVNSSAVDTPRLELNSFGFVSFILFLTALDGTKQIARLATLASMSVDCAQWLSNSTTQHCRHKSKHYTQNCIIHTNISFRK